MFDVETKKLVYAMLYGKKTVARLGKCITRDNSRRLPPKFFFQLHPCVGFKSLE